MSLDNIEQPPEQKIHGNKFDWKWRYIFSEMLMIYFLWFIQHFIMVYPDSLLLNYMFTWTGNPSLRIWEISLSVYQ